LAVPELASHNRSSGTLLRSTVGGGLAGRTEVIGQA
jgi:hypothetical protein